MLTIGFVTGLTGRSDGLACRQLAIGVADVHCASYMLGTH